jgi:hypothetical protein
MRTCLRLLPSAVILCLLLSAGISMAGGPHRPIRKKPEPAKTPPPKTEEGEQPAELQPRFPLYLMFGETGGSGTADPSVPEASELLALFDAVPFLRLNPWVVWGEGEGKPGESGRRIRLAYLLEKGRLFDELVRTASEVSSVAGSLAEAGLWSAADAAVLRIDEERLRICREEIDEQAARLREAGAPAPESDVPGLPRVQELPAAGPDASERVRRIIREAGSVQESLKRYDGKLLPGLEEILGPAQEAYDRGEAGLTALARYRIALLIAKVEALNLAYRLSSLLLDLEEATGEGRSGPPSRGAIQ